MHFLQDVIYSDFPKPHHTDLFRFCFGLEPVLEPHRVARFSDSSRTAQLQGVAVMATVLPW